MNDLHWTGKRTLNGRSITIHYDVISSLRGGWTVMVSAGSRSVRREGLHSREAGRLWIRDAFGAPLNDNSPSERWSFDAMLLGIDVKTLKQQIKLADEVMEEIIAEEKRGR